MKDLGELDFPETVRYTEDHEWAAVDGETVRIGVSDYAQDQLGDIVYVEMPEIGDIFEEGDGFGTLEAVKAVSEIYMPVGGEVVAVNEALVDTPELINQDPYGAWIVEIRVTDVGEYDELMSAEDYLEMLRR